MKRKYLFASLALAALAAIAASITPNNPVPQSWATANGKQAFSLNTNAVPVITINGTNYTGVTTNYAVTNISTITVKNGVITSIQ